ncbi:DEAD/DEAH box helicase [uncultured Desulfosarcina sp.]|uniref:DEAD/DEAH box helicase n=1 Tax=uncultured Desulfosarcina sp. TaxID=218289 RepID=UPI0029C94F48|nr:DEAD/DEAH box helicase [uncultured Desulfosarcina sp.]
MSPIILKKEPSYLKRQEAFSYQEEAVRAVRGLEYSAVFHEQGLGKTKIAIDLALYWLEKKELDTILFIVKKGLIANWQREFGIHAHIKPKVLSQNRNDNYFVFNSPVKVIITNYEVIKAEEKRIKLFLKTRNVGAILDESAKIKNPDSALTKVFLEIAPQFKKRVILTGTPIANRPYDMWAQIHFLDQGKSLGESFKRFKGNLDLSNKLHRDKCRRDDFENNLSHLFEKISPFSVRETKNSGIVSLPRKIYEKIETQWERYQLELYRQIQKEERAVIIKNGIPEEDRSDEILKRLLRLLQVASNPKLIDKHYSREPGKFEYLDNLLTGIIANGEKAIVWTSFTDNVDWLKSEFARFNACKVHGKINIDRRNISIDRFLKDETCKVLIATPGAAKEGLTLTVANHVIFYDRGFSLDDYLQAQDRIHRISQEKECYIYNLIMKDSIDEWVDVLLQAKELSAQLGQGDISLDYYKSKINYSFGQIIKSILNIEE